MEENNFIHNNKKIKISRKIFLNDQGLYKRKHETLLRDLRECLNPWGKKIIKKSSTIEVPLSLQLM